MATPRSQWISCSPGWNGRRARPLSSIVRRHTNRTGHVNVGLNQVTEGAKIKQVFALRRTRQIAATVPFLVALVVFVAGLDKADETVFGLAPIIWAPVLMVLMIVVGVVSFVNWRCPACDGYLGKNWNPNFCPKCGAGLR